MGKATLYFLFSSVYGGGGEGLVFSLPEFVFDYDFFFFQMTRDIIYFFIFFFFLAWGGRGGVQEGLFFPSARICFSLTKIFGFSFFFLT